MKVDGMDDLQIREFALFLYEKNQKKSKQLDEMIARLDEIRQDLKEAKKQSIVFLLKTRRLRKSYWNIKL